MSLLYSDDPPPKTFEQQWLTLVGAPPERAAEITARSRARARRFPWPINRLYPLLVWLFDWFAPLLFTLRLRRARSLSPERLDHLLRKVKGHRLGVIRALMVLVLHPLMEALSPEEDPPPRPHPLDGALDHRIANSADSADSADSAEFDVVVIGTGAGGAPVAWQLAQRGVRVAMIEKGGLVRPSTAPRCIEKHYVSQGMICSLAGGATLILTGSSIGGTTSINSGTCLRPLTSQLEKWDADWGTRFGSGALEPYLDRVSDLIGITVPPMPLMSKSSLLVNRGLEALARDPGTILPRNAPGCAGSGRCCFGCPTDAKKGTDHAFLPQAVAAGATLLHGTTATRIRERPDRVEVTLETPEGTRHVRCRQLIIAGGALFSPGLIRRNRLGTCWRKAGRFLKIHPASKVFGYFPGLQHGDGGVPQGLGYRPPELPRVTTEGIHTPKSVVGSMVVAAGARWRWWMDRVDDLASHGLMTRDVTTGRVVELAGFPVVRYRAHPDNVRDITSGVRLIGDIFFAAGAERVLLPFGGTTHEFANAGELEAVDWSALTSQNLLLSGFHPQGTAGIGRVVDTDLRLHGTERTSICDASVMPDSPGVNPMVTIMALSLRLADRIAGELERRP
ncbi:MAG: GMC family oxidoreductase N-terminal domain-containing protein [Myxococcota bacterium]